MKATVIKTKVIYGKQNPQNNQKKSQRQKDREANSVPQGTRINSE